MNTEVVFERDNLQIQILLTGFVTEVLYFFSYILEINYILSVLHLLREDQECLLLNMYFIQYENIWKENANITKLKVFFRNMLL